MILFLDDEVRLCRFPAFGWAPTTSTSYLIHRQMNSLDLISHPPFFRQEDINYEYSTWLAFSRTINCLSIYWPFSLNSIFQYCNICSLLTSWPQSCHICPGYNIFPWNGINTICNQAKSTLRSIYDHYWHYP